MKKKSSLINFAFSGFLTFCNLETALSAETTADFLASATLSSSCSISATTMTFASYTGAAINATSDITVNCTYNTDFTTYIADTPDGGDSVSYKLVRYGTDGSASGNYLLVTLKKNNNSGAQMTSGAATFTGTGSGSGASIGAIYGAIDSGQTNRAPGTFSKVFTLNIVY